MPDPATIERLRLSVLSATALKELQPDWSDPVIDEWLNLLDSLGTIASVIDTGIDDTTEEARAFFFARIY